MATDGKEDSEELIKLAAEWNKWPSEPGARFLRLPQIVGDRKAEPKATATAPVELLREAIELLHALARENERLRSDKKRQLLAEALLNYRRRGGRPARHSPESEDELFAKFDALYRLFRIPEGRGAIPALCRKLNADLPLSKRLGRMALEQQIKTIQNRWAKAKARKRFTE